MMPGKIPDPMSSKGDIDLTKIKWHALSPEEALEILGSSKKGLSAEEAKRRLEIYGYNELEEKRKKTVWGTFVEQFKSFLVAILLFAILFSIIMEDFIDAGAIASILIINAVLGTVQEYRAEKSLEALKRLAAPKAKVIREGLETVVPAKELVPGDLVVLRVGDKVPADCRLVESYNLRCDEAILTGESVPVEKDPTVVLDEATPLPERRNMAYSSTTITYGHGIGVVVSTGMNTEVGKIAEMLRGEEEGTTPLQERLDRFGKKLGVIILLLCAIVAVSEIIEYGGLHDLKVFENAILTSISLAVSAVPEGLPAVVTVTLAMGMRRMARRNAIVRKLAAVETLGSATVICSDKTGTITRNEMTVREVWIYDKTIEVTGEGYKPQGKFILRSMDSSEEIFPKDFQGLSLLLKTGVLCNDASLVYTEGELHTSGDPTELALVVLGAKAGMLKERLEEEEPRVDEIPFDSARKMMTTIHRSSETLVAYSKGAPEALLKVCDRMLVNGKIMELSDDKKAEILSNVEDMAKRAMRVLALA
ncbi:MAG TPA: ATPase, partial [Candidatus Korarchaeota archaeon]|nr:ATPase [Candidatus Korarchaeota archaeon]